MSGINVGLIVVLGSATEDETSPVEETRGVRRLDT